MKPELRLKFRRSFAQKQSNTGFTLIELLVVVIIIGVLAAIALPNLLSQVGKARETEAKSNIGNINHAQQTFFAQNAVFATNLADLQVTIPALKYYNLPTLGDTAANSGATLMQGQDNAQQGTRDYLGAVAYNTTTKSFTTIMGRANNAVRNTTPQPFTLDLADAAIVGAGTDDAAFSSNVEEIR